MHVNIRPQFVKTTFDPFLVMARIVRRHTNSQNSLYTQSVKFHMYIVHIINVYFNEGLKRHTHKNGVSQLRRDMDDGNNVHIMF